MAQGPLSQGIGSFFVLFSLLKVKLRWGQRGILAVPLVLWVSLYRIFYMGRVFDFLGMWVEQSYISLAFGDFYYPGPPPILLWRPSSSWEAAQPSLLLNLPCNVPHIPSARQALAQRCRVAQPIPACPEPLDTPAPSNLVVTCRTHSHPVQTFQCAPAWQLSQFQPLLLVPFTWAIDPTSSLREKPQFLCACSQAHPQPWCHPAWCFTLSHGQGGAQVSGGTFLVCSVYPTQTPGVV